MSYDNDNFDNSNINNDPNSFSNTGGRRGAGNAGGKCSKHGAADTSLTLMPQITGM